MSLTRARKAMAALRSYTYKATTTTTAPAGTSTTSTFAGTVLNPDRTRYTAATGRSTFEIIRIGATGYRRVTGGQWSKLPAQKKPPPPPGATLLAVLDRLGPLPVPADGKVSATLSPRDANSAGLASGPGITTPVAVTLVIDTTGRVDRFDATVTLSDTRSTLHTTTDFSGFDATGNIVPPV